ncbi:MAG: hypothetical protein AB9891_20970 [Anaerolineaceae bacterium]
MQRFIENNFGMLVLLSSLNDGAASDGLNTLLLKAVKEDRAKLFSILEKVGWEPVKEAGAWYWIEKKEWDKAGALGKPAARPLMEFITDESRDQREKIKAAGALSLTGEKSVIQK